jgi:hypothetical protein
MRPKSFVPGALITFIMLAVALIARGGATS